MTAGREPRRWIVYLLRCGDGSLYCGITNALAARLAAHAAGRGGRYTRSRLPVALAWRRTRQTATEARRLEWALKQEPRAAKLALAAGDERAWRRLCRRVLRGRRDSRRRGPAV